MPPTLRAAQAAAPGKIILFGEHAVVYGRPAVAVPLTAVQATAAAQPAVCGAGLTIHVPDIRAKVRVTAAGEGGRLYDALAFPAVLALQAAGYPFPHMIPDLAVTVRSTIPIASGLGSGAAIATAVIRVMLAAVSHDLPCEEINALVYEVEKRHHGTPSGIDNTVIVYAQPVYFVREKPIQTFTIAQPFTLLVADTGIPSPTRESVADVRRLHEQDERLYNAVFDGIGQIAEGARAAIESGAVARLGGLMRANHALLQRLTVSSDALDRLCAVAESAGALGAKLSGGGRGGNLIALVTPETAGAVAAALREAGAVRVIETVVGKPV